MKQRLFAMPELGPSAFHQRRECSWRPVRLLPEGDHGAGDGAGAASGAAGAAGSAGAGAAGAGAAGGAAAGQGAAGATGAAGAGGQGSAGAPDKGFPEGTPIAQMTPEQQANYWKHQSRQHEDRVKALGITPEQLKTLQDKAARADALDYELASDKEKAVKDATTAAEKSATDKYVPALVRAEFKAAVAGKVAPEQLEEWIEKKVNVLDLTKFLAADGSVDTAKVAAFVDDVQPATGNIRRGPSPAGQGYRPPGQAEPGAQGRAQAQKRFGIKADA